MPTHTIQYNPPNVIETLEGIFNKGKDLLKRRELINEDLDTFLEEEGKYKKDPPLLKSIKEGIEQAEKNLQCSKNELRSQLIKTLNNEGYKEYEVEPKISDLYEVVGQPFIKKREDYSRNSLDVIILGNDIDNNQNLVYVNVPSERGVIEVMTGEYPNKYKKSPERISDIKQLVFGSLGTPILAYIFYKNCNNPNPESLTHSIIGGLALIGLFFSASSLFCQTYQNIENKFLVKKAKKYIKENNIKLIEGLDNIKNTDAFKSLNI